MIPVETIIAFGISSFFTLLFPIILMIVLVAKQKIAPRPLLIGMLAFLSHRFYSAFQSSMCFPRRVGFFLSHSSR